MEWINIKDKIPEDEQDVWYFFDHFKKVYEGKFTRDDISEHFDAPLGTYFTNCFYGEHGFLCDDVEWWMPRVDENRPAPPFGSSHQVDENTWEFG